MDKFSKKILIGLLIVAIVGGTFFLTRQKISDKLPQTKSAITPKEELIDYKASFAIFTNSTFRIFTATMYHNLSKDVFIQSDNPNIVHVKKAGIIWNDFFKTLPMELTKDCLTTGTSQTFCTGSNGTLKFYINGQKADDLLDLKINSGDRALISFGNDNEDELQKQLQQVADMK